MLANPLRFVSLLIAPLLFACSLGSHVGQAQMVHTASPLQSIGSSYSEGGGVSWSLRGPNWFANFGGGGPLLPPFGPVDPGGGLRGGFRFGGGDVSGSLRFHFGQSSQQSIVSTTPSLTTTNGFPGSIQSGVVQPFVIGLTPVVGGYTAATAPLQEAQATAHQLGQAQMSSLRHSQLELQNRKLAQYLQRAERAESEGEIRIARANYRLAIGVAAEPLRSQLRWRMKRMLEVSKEQQDQEP